MAVAPKLSTPPYPGNYRTGTEAAPREADASPAEARPVPGDIAATPPDLNLEAPLESLYAPRLRSLAVVLLTLGFGYLGASYLSRNQAAGVWQLHEINLGIALTLLLCSYAPSFLRKVWRDAALVSCVLIIANTARIGFHGGAHGGVLIVAVAVMVSSSSLIPWSSGWQALVGATATIAFALASSTHPVHHPALWTQWFGLFAAMAIAQANVYVQRRSHRLLEKHFEALESAQRTQRKVAEHAAALQESEETLGKLFDASLDAMALIEDRSGILIDVNREYLRITGFTREEVIGRTTSQVNFWGDDEQRRQVMLQLHERGEAPDMEFDLRTKDGRIVPCLLSAVTVKIGPRTLLFATTRDISERKAAERKAAEHVATLRKLFEASPDVITLNRLSDGAYVDVSDSFESTGFRAEEAIGRTVSELGIWTDRQLRNFMKILRESGSVSGMEIESRTHDGTIVPTLISSTIVEINGEPCVASFTRDISPLKRTENDLRAAREAALAASRAKSEFLSNMSHDIRTPMNAILGMAELMRDTELSAEQSRYLNVLANNGSVLLKLINDILDLARVESGRITIESAEFDLIDLIEDVADSLAVNAHQKGLELALRIADSVPRFVIGDSMRLRQVITNLAANAVKFTERGEVVITVAPKDAQHPDTLLFSFSDTGMGIPSEQLSSIFSPFAQGDSSTSRKYGGSGLGLAIVDRLVGLMGGQVSVESQPGRGSVFTFTAKLALAEKPNAADDAGAIHIDGVRMLLVDDSAISRQIIREMLPGARLMECVSAAEALAAMQDAERDQDPYRVLLIDSRMPVIDGFEMVSLLRNRNPNTGPAIVMLCASDGPSTLARMRELRVDGYAFKPLKRRDVLEMIARILAPAQASQPQPATPEPAAETKPEPGPETGPPLRILLADDSDDNRVVIRTYLRKMPYVVEEASDGQTAIEMCRSRSYDLVLMDAQMPGIDGYAAARAIREWEQRYQLTRIPIVALTASAFEDAIRQALEAGCDLHVSKPVSRATLLDAIAKLVGRFAPEPVEVEEDMREVVPGFLERKGADIETMTAAIDNADFTSAASLAHKLKGEGGTYGIDRISRIGAQLELAAKDRDGDRARALTLELSRYLRQLVVIYRPADSDSTKQAAAAG